jgi:hypothetical protein
MTRNGSLAVCDSQSLHPFQQLPRVTQQRPNLPSLGDRIPAEQAVRARSGLPLARRIPVRRRACGSASCRAPPASGTPRQRVLAPQRGLASIGPVLLI